MTKFELSIVAWVILYHMYLEPLQFKTRNNIFSLEKMGGGYTHPSKGHMYSWLQIIQCFFFCCSLSSFNGRSLTFHIYTITSPTLATMSNLILYVGTYIQVLFCYYKMSLPLSLENFNSGLCYALFILYLSICLCLGFLFIRD